MTPVLLDEIDLSDPDLYATGDPHAVWTHLRANAPVFFQKHGYGPGFWAITKYDDVVALSSDRRLASSGGRTTTGRPREPGPGGRGAPDGTGVADILVVTDPPRHTQLRALVNKAFTPRVIAALEPYVQNIVDGILEELRERSRCDFATDVAARIPFTVICQLLGVPEADRGALSHAVGIFMESRAHTHDEPRDDIELGRYFLDLAHERRANPRDDLVSRLVAAEVDGERLSDADVLALAMLLFIAGSETTMNGMSGGMLAFVEHPEQARRLIDDPVLWPKAVEEILRWVSPVLNGMVRTALDDIVVRDTLIARGDKVTLWYPSANRDEEVFAEPFTFDVARDPNPHITFGAGWHFCLGASLARLEIRVALRSMLGVLSDIELDGEVQRLRSNVSGSIEHLPIRYAA
ncbi:MAG TPA: cytochrome P450 [Actinomycetota bacterium]|nr:cytochrome P450 [Actinomycetota bacterium]